MRPLQQRIIRARIKSRLIWSPWGLKLGWAAAHSLALPPSQRFLSEKLLGFSMQEHQEKQTHYLYVYMGTIQVVIVKPIGEGNNYTSSFSFVLFYFFVVKSNSYLKKGVMGLLLDLLIIITVFC
jgi:hypothetical protein